MHLPGKKILNVIATYFFSWGKENITEPVKLAIPLSGVKLGVM